MDNAPQSVKDDQNHDDDLVSGTKEHMLIALWGREPRTETDKIRSRFPHIEITYFEVSAVNNFVDVLEVADQVPAVDATELWKKATILVTLFALPRSRLVAPNLRYIHIFSSGIDHFLTPSNPHPLLLDLLQLHSSSSISSSSPDSTSPSQPITMTTSRGISAPPIAEWVVMTLLSLTNQFPLCQTWQRNHHWGTKPPFLTRQGDWARSRTVGILGYGSIGRHLARILTAMNTTIHAYTLNPRTTPTSRRDKSYRVPGTGDPEGSFPKQWFHNDPNGQESGLGKFLASGLHALVICLPLTPDTKGLIGPREFQIFKDSSPYHDRDEKGDKIGGYIVNISRGSIVDQDSLIDALRNRVIRGAALDVTDPEPLPEDSELWEMDNVIVTPHISALGEEYSPRAFEVLRENLERRERGQGSEEGAGGEEMWNVVQMGKGY